MKSVNDKSMWIWYPGDFEIYHGMMQNFEREERGFDWPAYWNIDDCRKNVKFSKTFSLKKIESFYVKGTGRGYVDLNGKKYPLDTWIECSTGNNEITVFIGNPSGIPSVYIEGISIYSDETWKVDDFINETGVGYSSLYTKKEQDPNIVEFKEEEYLPVDIRAINDGVIYDFGRAITGIVIIDANKSGHFFTLCYGESEKEALDVEECYYKQENVNIDSDIRKRAFRYIYIPNVNINEIEIKAVHQFVPMNVKGIFKCEDETLNRIWQVSTETFKLCSGLFFIDGIKRDRWIWSGDAYQSYLINQYLFFDEEINTRTMIALRGNDIVKQHINTIVDYSLLWIIGIENHYLMAKDIPFIKNIYPKMVNMMDYCMKQLDGNGFIDGKERDWIFIDWSDIDKEGTVSAEQILLLKCYKTMMTCGGLLNKDTGEYENKYNDLYKNIMKYFWDEEKGAFIDSYKSGKRHITRHANIFAILFDLIDEEKIESIVTNVILNPDITEITTPYFKFYELDVLCKLGYLDKVYSVIKEYWGGMLEKGSVTFWEEFKTGESTEEMYSMYGDPYGKSLCHAWGASPIYLLGKYFIGVKALKPGYEVFKIEPKLEYFKKLQCVIPVKNGEVKINYKKGEGFIVSTNKNGAVLQVNGREYFLEKDKPLQIKGI